MKEKAIEQLDTEDWELFLGQRIPVLIVKYDIPKQEFYWEIAQDYLWDIIEKEDPNWKRQKSKSIKLTKKIKDLSEIKKAILVSQKRITRYHSMNLGIGEGIKIDPRDLSNLSKVRERALEEYKILSLQESYYLRKAGDREAAVKRLTEVYNSPKNDETKLRATIGLIFELNIIDLEENKKVIELANEAIKLAENLNKNYLKDYSIVLRDQAILVLVLKKMSQLQLGLKVQEVHVEQTFSLFYFQELAKLNQMRLDVVKEINDSLLNLISNKHVYYYLYALSILIDSETETVQLMMFSVFNKAVIDQEKTLRRYFIEQAETALTSISDIDLKKSLLRSLANYYYWTQRNEKAVSLITEAISLAEKDGDNLFKEDNKKLLERMKNKPDPHQMKEDKDIDDLTVEEYQEMTRRLLVGQGFSLEATDRLTSLIRIALSDMNPKPYLQFCEHLHIGYINTSKIGASIGLPSMGRKIVWCKHCKSSIDGFDLQGTFDIFQKENCESCTFLKTRDKDWKCYVKWVKEQQKDIPRFKEPLGK